MEKEILKEEIRIDGIKMKKRRKEEEDVEGVLRWKIKSEIMKGEGEIEIGKELREEELDKWKGDWNECIVVRNEIKMLRKNENKNIDEGMGGEEMKDGEEWKMKKEVIDEKWLKNIDERSEDELREIDMERIVIDRERSVDMEKFEENNKRKEVGNDEWLRMIVGKIDGGKKGEEMKLEDLWESVKEKIGIEIGKRLVNKKWEGMEEKWEGKWKKMEMEKGNMERIEVEKVVDIEDGRGWNEMIMDGGEIVEMEGKEGEDKRKELN